MLGKFKKTGRTFESFANEFLYNLNSFKDKFLSYSNQSNETQLTCFCDEEMALINVFKEHFLKIYATSS